ncbi:MAG: transposase [Gemella sp.]|nr:transposase [Gemella sp.]
MANSIKKLLQIQDENIEIKGEIQEEIIKGQRTQIIEGTLSYDVENCRCTNCKKEDQKIVKNGHRETKIKLLKTSELPVILKLKKQIYQCKNCKQKFTAQTRLVEKNCNISNQVKATMLGKLKELLSNKYIAKDLNISQSPVIRTMQAVSKYIEHNAYKDLLRNLCFDEIKTAENKMSFIFADAETGRLIDIVDARNYTKLKNYFIRIPLKIRKKVQTISIDIYPPYMKLIRELFPIVQNVNREFNKYRIEIMNRYKNKEKGNYTKLKKYWKLLLKDETEIQYAKTHYSKTFGRTVSNKY